MSSSLGDDKVSQVEARFARELAQMRSRIYDLEQSVEDLEEENQRLRELVTEEEWQ